MLGLRCSHPTFSLLTLFPVTIKTGQRGRGKGKGAAAAATGNGAGHAGASKAAKAPAVPRVWGNGDVPDVEDITEYSSDEDMNTQVSIDAHVGGLLNAEFLLRMLPSQNFAMAGT